MTRPSIGCAGSSTSSSARTAAGWGDFRLTPECGQKLAALLGPLTKPQTTSVETTGEDGQPGAKHLQPDDRTQGQRRHDAVEDVLDAALRTDDLPASGGTPTTLIIVMTYREWVTKLGTGTYGDGSPVSARTARDLADQAEVVWCVKDRHGKVLDLHRTRRIASRSQTLALCARDGGCSFPGCDVPPQWCERHHIISWQDGGPTNLSNLTLLCRYHHHHFAKRGWTCRINQHGLPVWHPPRWIDPQQRPILHPRISISNWNPHDPLDLDPTPETPD